MAGYAAKGAGCTRCSAEPKGLAHPGASAYLGGMRGYFRHISPKRAVQEFAGEWNAPTPYRWHILGIAAALTFSMLYFLIPKSTRVPPERPEVIWITTFAEGRTAGEIIASNCANQELKDELEARLAARAELRRDLYKQLGRATFIDVEAMEAEIEAERAAEEAAAPPVDEPTPEELALSIEEYCSRATG